MAAVTAAVIAGVATVASTGAGIAQSQGAFGGSSSGGSGASYSKTPMDPHQRAMRDYYARMVVENQDKTYPSFGEFLTSGGDPAKAEFDLTVPGMKPSEAAAFGLTGGRGEAVPYYDSSQGEGALSPEQRLYLAKERQRRAKETGGKQPTYTWAEATTNTRNLYANRRTRLEEAQAVPEADRTIAQQRAFNRLPDKLKEMESRHINLDLAKTGTGRGAPLPKQKKDDSGSPLKRILTGGTSGGG